MSNVTRFLESAQGGDRKAAADLLPLVYDELRKLAAAKMVAEAPGHSLNPTALVHEAYLRLTGEQSFESRSHFMRAAASRPAASPPFSPPIRRNPSRAISVSTQPGQIALTVMRRGASSSASALVNPMTPCFAAQ